MMDQVIDMKKLKIITNVSGDYEIIQADGDIIWSGHSIPHYVFLGILANLGVETETIEISDEEMEGY